MLVALYSVLGAVIFCILLEGVSKAGIIVGAIAAIVFSKMMHGMRKGNRSSFFGMWTIKYYALLIRDMIISTFKIAISVFYKNLPKVSIVHLKSNVNERGKVLVANSITLTPSTVTIEEKNKKYTVLYMDLSEKAEDRQRIAVDFEERIKHRRMHK